MLFYNPVRQAYIRPPGAPRIYGSFRVTQDFGPTSLDVEPKIIWPGGEGYPAGTYPLWHRGIDLGNAKCGDDVLAMGKGTVRKAGVTSSGLILVLIDHGGGWASGLLHLSSEIVSVGQIVVPSQKVGIMGSTGNSTGCHVHAAAKSGMDWSKSFFSDTNGKWLDLWPRLRQNVTVKIKTDGVNIRASAGSGSTLGSVYAASKPDGTIRRASDNLNLGAYSQPRKWGGTVIGATYTVAGVGGKTWEKIDLDGGWRYVATPLAGFSAT